MKEAIPNAEYIQAILECKTEGTSISNCNFQG